MATADSTRVSANEIIISFFILFSFAKLRRCIDPMRKKVGAALSSSTRLIRPACLSGLRVSRHLASRTLSPFSAFASPVEERAWRLRAYWKVRRMTHSNFPIWSKLLIIASARARFAPGGRRSVLVPSARGRTTSSMGIVEVSMTGVRSQRGMKRDSTPHHVCRSYGSFQGRPLHVLRNRTELVPRSMSAIASGC